MLHNVFVELVLYLFLYSPGHGTGSGVDQVECAKKESLWISCKIVIFVSK